MIPTEDGVKKLWDKYSLPEQKRIHVVLVARVAVFFAKKLVSETINVNLLRAAALLHDIDKSVGGPHPETAVKILHDEGLDKVADVVATHSLHSILGPKPPKTWEQKLLYLADKMVKYDIVGVDRRFALWRQEHLPHDAQQMIDDCYPKVKKLEQEVFNLAQISPGDILKMKESI